MALVLTALIALRETSEKWNGPANTPRCEEADIIRSWTDNFAEGERAILLQSASFTCRNGIDCVQDTFEGKYGFKCAAKGSGGKGSSGILDPYVTYMLTGATTEFHSEKPCAFFESLGEALGEASNLPTGCMADPGAMDAPSAIQPFRLPAYYPAQGWMLEPASCPTAQHATCQTPRRACGRQRPLACARTPSKGSVLTHQFLRAHTPNYLTLTP